MNPRFLCLLLLLALTELSILGLHSETHTAPAKPTYTYLTGNESVWRTFPKAPVAGSAVDVSDLAVILAAQAHRTDEQKKEAFLDQKYRIALLSDVIDPEFSTKYPETFILLEAVGTDAYLLNTQLKNLNARPRPYQLHPTLVTPLFPVVDTSYPSGHACGSMTQALVLGKIFPDRAEDLLKRARQVADSRVVAGVHNPSDIAAGQTVAELIFAELAKNPKFLKNLAAALKTDSLPTSVSVPRSS
jgi:acid phosphatase (class A)